MRYVACILLLAAPLLAQDTGGAPAAAPGADPAVLFPADAFAYLEVDASALTECAPQAQLAKIIGDPALKTLFSPAFAQLGIDPDKPIDALLGSVPVKELLDGRAAVGVRGVSIVVKEPNEREWEFRLSPGAPFDGRAMYRLQGLVQKAMFTFPGAGGNVTFTVDVDFLAVGKPGPLGRKLLEAMLGELGGEVTREAVKVAGLDATHIRVEVPPSGGLSYAYNFYAVEREGNAFLASHVDTLAQALSGGARASLAASPALTQARARLTGGRPLLLAHVDLALLLRMFAGFVPPILTDMCDIGGINSVNGVGLGLSLVDGGVRESFGVMLDGDPKGFWTLLDGMPGGLRSLEEAPPGALAAFGVKLDLGILRDRMRAYVAEVSPGNEDEFDPALSREVAPGFDIVTEVIPALGDEAAAFVYPAGMNEPLPGFVVRVNAKDEEALSALVAKLQAQIPARELTFAPVELPDGSKAVRVVIPNANRLGIPYDMHFTVAKRHFLLASSQKLLAEAMKWDGAKGNLLRDDPILPLVLKAGGGSPGNIAALAYVNLRGCGIEALKVPVWMQAIPADWLDPRGFAEMRRIPNHLTGAAIALRHDKGALVLDCFSPMGLLAPAAAAGIALAGQQAIAQRAVIPPPPEAPGRASLGITTKSSDGAGVKMLALAPNGPAAVAGLQQGDRIIGLDGVEINTMEDLDRELANRNPGDSVELKIRREGAEITVTVELGTEEAGW